MKYLEYFFRISLSGGMLYSCIFIYPRSKGNAVCHNIALALPFWALW